MLLFEFNFFRRICTDLPEDVGSIGEGWPAVNHKWIKSLRGWKKGGRRDPVFAFIRSCV